MITRSEALYFHKKYPSGLSKEEFSFIQTIVEKIEVDNNIKIQLNYAGVGALQCIIHTSTKDYDFKKTYLNLKKLGVPLLVMKDSIVETKCKLDSALSVLAYEESDLSVNEQSPRFNYHVQYSNRPDLLRDSEFVERILLKYSSIDDVADDDVIKEFYLGDKRRDL